MAAAQRPLPAVLLLLAVCAAGFGLWLLLGSEDDDVMPHADDAGVVGLTDGDAQSPAVRPESGAGAPAAGAEQGRGLPRVLPPDAAVEDVRDALALTGAEREASLAQARAAISRLAVQGPRVLSGLRSYAAAVEDPVVRGVVISALGSNRDGRHVRWLCTQLEEGETNAERIGALLALAYPVREAKDGATKRPHSAKSTTLGGLPYAFDPLPTSMPLLKSGSRFFDSASGAAAEDALPVLVLSVEAAPEWATLLVVDGSHMCAWYLALSEESRRRVRTAALKHERLSRDVRERIEAAD